MAHPIWKNFVVNLGTEDSVEYMIFRASGTILIPIYSGVAWKRPGDTSINVCINDICADWIVNTLPNISDDLNTEDLPIVFVVQKITNTGQYVEMARVRFVNDWSYESDYNVEQKGFASPISNHISLRQWMLWTGLDVSNVSVKVTLTNGKTTTYTVPVKVPSELESYPDFAKALSSAGSGTAVFTPSQWGNVAKIVINKVQYDVVDCARYALYYLNSYGGWDTLLVEGSSSEEDSLTRHTMNKSRINERQVVNYLNEIKKTITLHTSWLTDEQSLKMHHLLNSTNVYLHDLDKDELLPVIIDATSTPYKTYKGEGGKLVNYSIKVTIAQSRMRR